MPKEDETDGIHLVIPGRLATTIAVTVVGSVLSVLGYAGYQTNQAATHTESGVTRAEFESLRRELRETKLYCYPSSEAKSDQAHWSREFDRLQRRVNALDAG